MDNKRYLEIANKALEYSKSNFCPPDKDLTNYDIINAFDAGAQWADQNPAPNLVDIDKVCERLKSNFNHEEDICDFLKSNFPNELLAIAMIEQSKQAMKRE